MSAANDSIPPAKRRARSRQAALSTPPRKEAVSSPSPGHRWLMLIPALTFGLLVILFGLVAIDGRAFALVTRRAGARQG